ncbi:SNARE-associated protein Snapin isoform X2 [Zalophus californianus]|nr:SNARE-associated protein Snapin isoform X2 [Zalophus californianus]
MGGLSATGETSISFSPPQNTKDSRPQNCSSQPPGGLETPPNTASPGPPRNCCSARPAPDRGDSVSQKSPGWVQPAAPGRPLVVHFRATPVPGGPRGTFPAEGLLMMAAAGSAAVSGAGTPVAGPAGRDLFAEGLLEFLRPAVQQLDSHVHAVRESQVELREQIDNLATELCRINEDQKVALDLDPYVKKLLNARRRVVLVNNILQNAQERLRRLNHSVAKETARRRAMLDSGVYPPGSPSK